MASTKAQRQAAARKAAATRATNQGRALANRLDADERLQARLDREAMLM